ncbi:Ni/Fe hydrogenase subunit alpha [Thalassoroseus pseudoceratinae]|uniref:Ni/Fe hydrogenase subunit alpha n=1 Tax=Thalassoroseus pseudoceratinae TaxID=2713176 RepID=UPI00141E4057|nr:Ni/Fe hydrogenase subunit alpha [Thalassoroseus pseudoceratinae]
MAKRILIDPVTRIEGHAKISIYLDDADQVDHARFHVTEFRGFERMYEGRPFWEMPAITARVCGICPVSHLLASSRAGDELLAVEVPLPAKKLRRLNNLAQILQSHALSFFHLSAPDFLLGFDSDPVRRNVFGLIAEHPELARSGIRLRQFGQEIIERLGGKKIHPAWCVPGGVRSSLDDEDLRWIRDRIPESRDVTVQALELFKGLVEKFRQEAQSFGNFPSLHMGLVGVGGLWEHGEGTVRFVDSERKIVADGLDPRKFFDYIGEAVEPWSYLKSPYYRPLGYRDGMYRVGPLARLNVCDSMGTPLANKELDEFRQLGAGAVNASFFFHQARLIEVLACVERIEKMLDDPDLKSKDLRADAGVNRLEGVGCSEAPRGTLFHHYQIDENGLIRKANLVIATGQNNLAMNQTVTQIAREYISGPEIPEGVLNRIEAGIRAFDPCLSCSTHAIGQMPLHVEMVRSDGQIIDERQR